MPPLAPTSNPPVAPGRADDGPSLDFVCEDDVRAAIRSGRRIRLSEKAIVTPSARDLAEEHGVFA
jgi:hypothetical protein